MRIKPMFLCKINCFNKSLPQDVLLAIVKRINNTFIALNRELVNDTKMS